MSMGGDYAAGYNLGLQTGPGGSYSSTSTTGVNPGQLLGTILSAHPRNRNVIDYRTNTALLSSRKSAQDILNESKMEALKRKSLELDNQAKELQMKEDRLNQASIRGLRTAQTGEIEAGTRRSDLSTSIGEVERTRGITQADKSTREKQLMENAMRGFYTGDGEAVRRYFDEMGQPGVSVQDVIKASNGQIIVDFGDGKEARFNNPREAIEKLLVPASLIEKGLAGKMTEQQKKKMEQEDKKIDISRKRAEAYEKGVSMRPGSETTARDIDKRIDVLYKTYFSQEMRDGTPTEDIMDRTEFARSKGLTTEAGAQSVEDKERQLAKAAIDAGADPDKVKQRFKERTGRDY